MTQSLLVWGRLPLPPVYSCCLRWIPVASRSCHLSLFIASLRDDSVRDALYVFAPAPLHSAPSHDWAAVQEPEENL